MKNKKKKGFTLIELVIVIAIIGVLAAIAIPRYNTARKKAANTAHNANVQMLKSAAILRQSEINDSNTTITWTKDNQKDNNYVEKWPEIPAGADVSGDSYIVTITKDKIDVKPNEIQIQTKPDKKSVN
ncbi:type II secretion system protein [Anaerococcus sp. Marseille-P3625]|uniref:type II secretion system protein n=1 Tax=Anaerococcus sp. Marseille-P3625 TaxID=1977277 RepID=UPI000C07B37E|nr:type II secretion system protein [Anaerococcus sp. Marseille-P3625]